MTDLTPHTESTVKGAVLTATAKYASLLCVILLGALISVLRIFGNRLLSSLDANTDQLVKIQQRQALTEGGLIAANERIGEVVRQMTSRFDALGQWTRRNADDIDDLKKRVYPLSRSQ